MKQRIIPFVLVLAVVAVATPVLAQDIRANVSGIATGTPIKTRADVRTDIKERKATSTERRVEMQIGLAKKKAEHAARVLTATVERLERIITRLESRIAKVKAAGGATTEAEAFVAEAQTHLSLAKSSIALFASLDLTGQKARDNFEKVRAVAAEAKGHIREAHKSLKEAIRSLKGVRRDGVRGEATTTATST